MTSSSLSGFVSTGQFMATAAVFCGSRLVLLGDPKVIRGYFCDCVKQVKGVPRIVRADEDTQKRNIAAIVVILSLVIRALCMVSPFRIKGFKLAGLSFVLICVWIAAQKDKQLNTTSSRQTAATL